MNLLSQETSPLLVKMHALYVSVASITLSGEEDGSELHW